VVGVVGGKGFASPLLAGDIASKSDVTRGTALEDAIGTGPLCLGRRGFSDGDSPSDRSDPLENDAAIRSVR